MKTLSSLSGTELLQRTQDIVAIERRATMDLIEHLREIERRMLFLELGYSSLFDFAVKHLGLSEGSAQRRLAAMRLMRDVPEAKAKLESGELSLSNASRVQTVFRAAKLEPSAGGALTIEQKKDVLESILGLTQKECESKLLKMLPQAAPKVLERDRQVSEEHFELKMILSKDVHDKMKELQLLLSHSLVTGSASELFEILIEREISRQRKLKPVSSEESISNNSAGKISNKLSGKPSKKIPAADIQNTFNENLIQISTAAAVRTEIVRSRKHIPQALRREIWMRAGGSCEAKEKSGRCDSRHKLEVDHIIPYALGGGDTFENLRLYCRAHNVKHAMESYGVEVMERYREI
jgi:5-methylcytosine-specific restriction endonuclease McrA